MSPVSTLVLTIIPRIAAPGEYWVQPAHEGNPLAETPAHLDRQQMLALGYSLGAPQYDMALYTTRLTSKISHIVQKLICGAGSTETMQRNTLLKIRKIFRLLRERPRENVGTQGPDTPCVPTPNEGNQA